MSKVLFVPAWWPCSFFLDQQQITRDAYSPVVLYGTCEQISLKRRIKQIHKRKNSFRREEENVFTVNLNWTKFKSRRKLDRQLFALSEYTGQKILEIFKGQKPDLIHIQSISDVSIFIVEWAKRNNIPTILTEHVLFIRRSIGYFPSLKESVYSKVDKLLCVSNYLLRNLFTSGIPIKNAEVVGNLIVDDFVPDDFSDIIKNNRFLFVATHTHDKDIDTLLDTVAKASGQIVVDIAGLTGNELSETGQVLSAAIQEKELSAYINFLGPMSHEKVLKLYSEYSGVISTSKSETFGLSVAEAIASGTRVFCTDSGGIRDFVTENSGVVVPIGGSEELADALIEQCGNSYPSADQESKRILGRFGTEPFRSNLIRIYNSLSR